jgi:SAM-dependent methyltransferase
MTRDDRPPETRRLHLRRTFDEDAELYDRVRPRYPAGLYDDLAALTGAHPGSRLLELGCGTGQATVPLAARGYRVTALDAGPRMAEVARRNLARARAQAPAAQVVTSDFESWPLPEEPYDLVLSATAFHWIDPAVRTTKAADALRPGGSLAVVRTQHVQGGTEQFFVDVQRCYERFDPDTPPGLRPPAPDAVDSSDHADEVARSGRYGSTVSRRHLRDLTYTTSEYIALLQSYSNHRALPEDARNGLLTCIAALIDGEYGGRVTKRYLFELSVSPRH